MRSVIVDEDAVGVTGIITIAGDVPAAIDDEDAPAEHVRRPLGEDTADRPRPPDEEIDIAVDGCASSWLPAYRSLSGRRGDPIPPHHFVSMSLTSPLRRLRPSLASRPTYVAIFGGATIRLPAAGSHSARPGRAARDGEQRRGCPQTSILACHPCGR